MMKRGVVRGLFVFMAVSFILTFSLAAIAAEFSADFVQDGFGQKSTGKVYLKDKKMRIENNTEGKKSIMISDMEKKTAYMIMPDEKIYFEMPGMEAEEKWSQFDVDKELAKIATKKLTGIEKINGYICDKYEIIYNDKTLGTMTQWQAKKLNFPIKSVYHSARGDSTTEYQNIKEGGVSNSLFEIPAGYQKMDMQGMMNMFNKE